jgi:hypothetical protein
MNPAVTTTHAVPQKLLPARIPTSRTKLAICHHCFQILGSAHSSAERRRQEAEHQCKEKWNDQQPAAALPFN